MIRTVIKYTDNKILLNDAEVFETSKELFSGCYDIELDKYGEFKNFLSIKTPTVYSLMPSSELENIEDYVNKFLSEDYQDICKKSKILMKSGILLYGDAGIGKSNYINYLIKQTLDLQNSCVFSVNNPAKLYSIIPRIKELRAIQNNLFVIVFEEIDELFVSGGVEGVLKNFMDGIDSIDNCLFLASTNYIEKIPKSLTERPSRFKKCLRIEQSNDAEKVKSWLEGIYDNFITGLTKQDYEHLHEKCLNRTIDEIKHIIIDYKMGIVKIEKKQNLGFKRN